MVWMRTAALANFRKLWGIINEDLDEGTYKLEIMNYYSVDSFNGKKYFVLSTANAFGGKNDFLGISYIVMGVITLLIFFLFLIKKFQLDKKQKQKNKNM
ncbi:ligand-effect modulator 3 LEM3 family protein, putative [Ichthyophthirius multifiliis]|uniref:Ligand-effect modulator 3 LEM3 family protein, putative n=1 Tax=Ichthyophthirius multifiliis TaxID=5932 RepID=G0QLL6_ICHMU|nr:ligand-effect modulator 3 LEM3 family protein, putative [Ichthyophthirius multifiliis]EGR33889.1 ligand-effect modulator 3 LEM3 family protein, putative [Ichthyophthirius multifiliis]|eukprot:XP_004039113.1 ligand-effect modulator 3 LEM3 family protein, putative [Ichthyophthirius multifiliis]